MLRYAEIVEDIKSRSGKSMNIIIYREKSVPRNYEKLWYDLKIDYTTETRETSFVDNGTLNEYTKIQVGNFFFDNNKMEFKFELKIHEYDLTGDGIKEMNSMESKMNILKDLGGLLDSGACSNIEITIDDKTFKLHSEIMSRVLSMATVIEEDMMDSKLFEKFLRFVYTGEFGSDLSGEELIKMKSFAEKINYISLQNVCNNLMIKN